MSFDIYIEINYIPNTNWISIKENSIYSHVLTNKNILDAFTVNTILLLHVHVTASTK